LTAKSADGCCTKRWWFVAVVGPSGGFGGIAEGIDGLALGAEPDVGVHGRGHADVGVSQQFLDDDEFDALFQQEGGRQCRRSGNPMRRSLARRSRASKCRVRAAPSIGEPSGRVKT
jgi:hypothetical protein